MTVEPHPPVDEINEIALGAFFEDIGKFMQRAYGSVRNMADGPRAREQEILPSDGYGGYSHKHALWTEAFFDWMEKEGLSFPGNVNLSRVRDAAVYHHHPRLPLHWLSAVADRLSAGMDRAAKEERTGSAETAKGWDAFRRKPLACIFDQIEVGRGERPRALKAYPLRRLAPEAMFPADVDGDELPSCYAELWREFCEEFATLCRQETAADLFQQGLLSLSERYCWAIPSSTIDDPDISLHDHNRTVAAFAACLYRHHETSGDLDSERAIRDPERPKFRVLIGDISGIQKSLFRLKSEGVGGVNRTLRARSFLIGQIGETAALVCRRQFNLPPWVVLQNAGGRFQMLLADLPDIRNEVAALQNLIDNWMLDRYAGDLVLNIALTKPLAGRDFQSERFPKTLAAIAAAGDAAKQQPLASRLVGTNEKAAVVEIDFPADGACTTCGVRPAVVPDENGGKRCHTCADEDNKGRVVPKAAAVALLADGKRDTHPWFGDLRLKILAHDKTLSADAKRALVGGFRVWGERNVSVPFAERFVANHVPLLHQGDRHNNRYEGLSKEADDVKPGELKLFEQLAVDAREWDERSERWIGRAMLAVLKADVDDLGLVFSCGFRPKRSTIGRLSQLSRILDGFFTGYLTHLLDTDDRFRNVYTVYAGGDDLLLIAPWLTAIRLAWRLRADFGRFVNGNPNLTMSAGIEFFGPHEPLNRVVRRAEAKLKVAKSAKNGEDKDRVALVVPDHAIPWRGGRGSLDWALDEAEWLNGLIRQETLPVAFLYRMLSLDRQRDRDPGWQAKWHYHLARLLERLPAAPSDLGERLNRLMCGSSFDGTAAGGRMDGRHPDLRIPVTIALYRNR